MYLFLLLILTFSLTFAENPPPSVKIPTLGKIEGTQRISFKGQTFYSFEGVPYARPPVGKYRFREPSPLKPWHGILQAKTVYKCMQKYQYTPPGGDFVIGDEDCLYLNIYTPNLDPNANYDVIVYIHGGAFMFNWGAFQQPDYILDKNVVYISINYRLGPLGFLSTENDIVPGNNGLKDQIFALQFIKNNIKHFGGNPNSVTLMGMSAGGASVHFHYLSPKSHGLFHRGISQSGTMLNAWTLAEQPLQKSKHLATSLGCSDKNIKEMIECLKRRPARQIVAAVDEFQPWLYIPFSPFGAVVDSWSQDPVLPEHPYKLLQTKKVADVPWIVSYTNSEGLYPGADYYSDEYLGDIDKRWNELLPLILDYNYTVDARIRDDVSQKIRQRYISGSITKKNFMDFVGILSERLFTVDIEKTIVLQNAAMKSDVYFYYFTYRGDHSKSEGRAGTNKDFGAAHGDDVSYIFKTTMDAVSSETGKQMVELMTHMVAEFAKNGKPRLPVEWPPLPKNSKQMTYVKISSPKNLVLENSTLKNAEFWESLPIKENEKLFLNIKDEL